MALELRATGVFPAHVTAQGSDGKVDLKQTKEVVRFVYSKGVDGLYVCGSTGEGPLLSVDERKAVAEAALEAAEGRGTVMIHVGALATRDCLELARHAAKIGAHVVSSVPPFFYPATERSVIYHYRSIADACGLPVVIYDNPSNTGFTVPFSVVEELSEKGAAQGIKLNRQDLFFVAQLAELQSGRFAIYPVESFYLATLATAPVVGTIGSVSNWIPEAFVGIRRNFEAGNLKRAAYLQRLVCRLFAAFTYEEVPATKALLERRGVPCGPSWGPLVPMTQEDKNELYRAIDAFGVDFDSLAHVEAASR